MAGLIFLWQQAGATPTPPVYGYPQLTNVVQVIDTNKLPKKLKAKLPEAPKVKEVKKTLQEAKKIQPEKPTIDLLQVYLQQIEEYLSSLSPLISEVALLERQLLAQVLEDERRNYELLQLAILDQLEKERRRREQEEFDDIMTLMLLM